MTTDQWYHITIDDPALAPGQSVYALLKLILSIAEFKFVILNDIEGAGLPGLVYSLRENENTVLHLNQDFLRTLCDVNSFEWGDFFLFFRAPLEWDIEQYTGYPNIIGHTDTTIRVIDNQYLYIYTPIKEIADLIVSSYDIESYQFDDLTRYVYPT